MCMEAKLKDPAFVAKMAKFVNASEKGWDYAKKNDKEAAKIVLAADTTGAQTLHHQEQMMGEIAKLLDTGNGKLDPQGLRAHRVRTAFGRLRPGHHQEAGRRLDPRRLRRDEVNRTARVCAQLTLSMAGLASAVLFHEAVRFSRSTAASTSSHRSGSKPG